MITIEDLEIHEAIVWKSIKKFISNHPYFSLHAFFLISITLFFFVTVILMMAAVGGGQIEVYNDKEFAAGNITLEQHENTEWVVDIISWIYKITIILVQIWMILTTAILLYCTIRYVLMFKRTVKNNKKLIIDDINH